MSTPISVTIPHTLGRVEARRRIETGFGKMLQMIPGAAGGGSQRWDGDELSFGVVAAGQKIGGTVTVQDTEVRMDIELPGLLGLLAQALKDRIRKAGQLLLTKS